MKWLLGACIGAATIITAQAAYRSSFGQHVLRWIFYTDVRRAYPELYRWGTL